MNRRSLLRSVVVWLGASAAFGLLPRRVQAYYFYFFHYRFRYFVHRNHRRLRWRRRR
jgi:hypothetical protein